MADPPPPRDSDTDAYHTDERGARYLRSKAGMFVNRFSRIIAQGAPGQPSVELTHREAAHRGMDLSRAKQVTLIRETFDADLRNPLDPTHDPKPAIAQRIPTQALGTTGRYSAYVPSAWVAHARAAGRLPGPVDVVLWFGVGNELNRQGLRTAVERLAVARPVAFVEVPGIEPEDSGSFGRRWGIGVTDDMVRELVRRCFPGSVRVDVRITSLFAFSTGWMGFVGTLLNGLVTLSAVERAVIVDCLTALGGAQQALDRITQATRGTARIVTYASSQGGTDGLRARKLVLRVPARGVSFLDKHSFQVLTHARVLKAGIEDGIVPWKDIDPTKHAALRALFRALPPRGTVVSDPAVYRYVHGRGPSGAVVLDDWHRPLAVLGRAFRSALFQDLDGFRALTRLIWDNQLPGWSGRNDRPISAPIEAKHLVEGQHDFIPFEFFWETLQ